MSYLKLFLLFVKIGAILLGGGYVILPIMQNEFVDKRKLISQDELINFYALSQSLPGIVAANISMFVGYKLKGLIGALTAMIGIIFVPFWCIILLASILSAIAQNSFIQGTLWGIGIAVTALIILTTREMWQNSKRNIFFYVVFILSLIGLLFFNLSPVCVIVMFTVFGTTIRAIQRRYK